jgi:hypothetical protein
MASFHRRGILTEKQKKPRKWRRRLLLAVGGLLAFVVLALALILLVFSTPWGKEKLRGFAETQLRAALVGDGHIGKI